MKVNSKKLIISLAASAVILASVSTAITFAWLTQPKWNDIALDTGDKKIQTHIINRNFLKKYTANGVYEELDVNSNVNLQTPEALPVAGVTYDTALNCDFLNGDFLLNENLGYVQNYENFWFAFSEYNVKQDLKDVFLRGNYKVNLIIDPLNVPSNVDLVNDYANLIKVNCINDSNNYIFDNPDVRASDHSILSSKTHMNSLIEYNETLTKVPVNSDLVLPFFGDKDAPETNTSNVYANTNNNENLPAATTNKYHRMSYALGIGIGFYLDPMEFYKLIKDGKIGKKFKFTINLSVTLNVSNKPFTDTGVTEPQE